MGFTRLPGDERDRQVESAAERGRAQRLGSQQAGSSMEQSNPASPSQMHGSRRCALPLLQLPVSQAPPLWQRSGTAAAALMLHCWAAPRPPVSPPMNSATLQSARAVSSLLGPRNSSPAALAALARLHPAAGTYPIHSDSLQERSALWGPRSASALRLSASPRLAAQRDRSESPF